MKATREERVKSNSSGLLLGILLSESQRTSKVELSQRKIRPILWQRWKQPGSQNASWRETSKGWLRTREGKRVERPSKVEWQKRPKTQHRANRQVLWEVGKVSRSFLGPPLERSCANPLVRLSRGKEGRKLQGIRQERSTPPASKRRENGIGQRQSERRQRRLRGTPAKIGRKISWPWAAKSNFVETRTTSVPAVESTKEERGRPGRPPNPRAKVRRWRRSDSKRIPRDDKRRRPPVK